MLNNERARDIRLPIREATLTVAPIGKHYIVLFDSVGQVFHLAINAEDKELARAIVHRINGVEGE